MLKRWMIGLAIVLLQVTVAAQAADTGQSSRQPDKTLIIDGSIVHNVGALRNHVTNWGLIGSHPSVPSTFSGAPSARWPEAGVVDYLWGAGFWIGGTVPGGTLVSTAEYSHEIIAAADPVDIIYATAQGAAGGNRYPWPAADDDGDGLEDEDPLDGRDNDQDGLIDEDFAAAADQEFRCVMWDTTALARASYPEHTPLNLKVVQGTFQWDDPLAADFIGYEYAVTNIGVTPISDVHCGLFADFDIGDPDDDIAGSWIGLIHTPYGPFVPVSLAWMRDGTGSVPGYAAWVMCGVSTDAAAGGPPDPLQMWSFNRFSGQAAFAQGGDPTNDAERYQLLSTPRIDPDVIPGRYADYRLLLSAPRVDVLAPGETVVFRCALVMGETFLDLQINAGEAVITALGRNFDRDGDPLNGEEFNVPWLRPEDAPVAALSGWLTPAAMAGGVDLAFSVRQADGLPVRVARRARPGLEARTWDSLDSSGSVTDLDAGPWPRTYDLMAGSTGSGLVLDTVEVAGPLMLALDLKGSPNPFNPRLTLDFSLPEATWARLVVCDLRGRMVRELFAEIRPAGSDQVIWDGVDDGGHPVASGVYTARLETPQGVAERRVTLLK